jgi:hypothetical protein
MTDKANISVGSNPGKGGIQLTYEARGRATVLAFDPGTAERVGRELIAHADMVRRAREVQATATRRSSGR